MGFGPEGWGGTLLRGAIVTIAVALCGFGFGIALGALGAWAKIGGNAVFRSVANLYTTVLRGVPDLLVIYLFYFGGSAVIGGIGHLFGATGFIGLPGFVAGSMAVGVTSGAQQTEVFRGAFRAVSRGEIEAARACGMSPSLAFRRIIAPLTLRHALPGLGNVWQVVLKESSLVSITGVADLVRQSQVGADSTGRPFDFYVAAGALYLLISTVSGGLQHAAERRTTRGLRRA